MAEVSDIAPGGNQTYQFRPKGARDERVNYRETYEVLRQVEEIVQSGIFPDFRTVSDSLRDGMMRHLMFCEASAPMGALKAQLQRTISLAQLEASTAAARDERKHYENLMEMLQEEAHALRNDPVEKARLLYRTRADAKRLNGSSYAAKVIALVDQLLKS